MGLGGCIILIAAGAILTFATDWKVEGANLDVVGLILMAVGIIGVATFTSIARRPSASSCRRRRRWSTRSATATATSDGAGSSPWQGHPPGSLCPVPTRAGVTVNRSRVVVVGAGFAGFQAARALSRTARDEAEIILLNPTDYFLYLPLLPQVAAGILEPRRVSVSLPAHCRGYVCSWARPPESIWTRGASGSPIPRAAPARWSTTVWCLPSAV